MTIGGVRIDNETISCGFSKCDKNCEKIVLEAMSEFQGGRSEVEIKSVVGDNLTNITSTGDNLTTWGEFICESNR